MILAKIEADNQEHILVVGLSLDNLRRAIQHNSIIVQLHHVGYSKQFILITATQNPTDDTQQVANMEAEVYRQATGAEEGIIVTLGGVTMTRLRRGEVIQTHYPRSLPGTKSLLLYYGASDERMETELRARGLIGPGTEVKYLTEDLDPTNNLSENETCPSPESPL